MFFPQLAKPLTQSSAPGNHLWSAQSVSFGQRPYHRPGCRRGLPHAEARMLNCSWAGNRPTQEPSEGVKRILV
jgi:hypothetical protein